MWMNTTLSHARYEQMFFHVVQTTMKFDTKFMFVNPSRVFQEANVSGELWELWVSRADIVQCTLINAPKDIN